MVPKYSNPHLIAQTTHTVSRAQLGRDDDSDHDRAIEGTSSDILLLENLLKRSLGDFQADLVAQVDSTAAAKPEKTKRRKTTHEVPVSESDPVNPQVDDAVGMLHYERIVAH